MIAQQNPEPDAQLARDGDTGFAEAFLLQLASVETSQRRIASFGVNRGLTPEEPQHCIPLFGHRAESLPRPARVFARNQTDIAGEGLRIGEACGIAEKDFGRQGRDRPHTGMRHQPAGLWPLLGRLGHLVIEGVDQRRQMRVQRLQF